MGRIVLKAAFSVSEFPKMAQRSIGNITVVAEKEIILK
jgi:hypothetical protein